MGYTTLPRSLNYRRSGVHDWTRKNVHATSILPRSLDYRHSGVQDWTERKEVDTNTPPQLQLATGNVEAGAELGERRGGESLGEDVGELGGGRHVEDPNIADGDLVTNEVEVNLHVLRPLVLNRVGGEVHRANVVAVDKSALGE